jgi:hypothetical protein
MGWSAFISLIELMLNFVVCRICVLLPHRLTRLLLHATQRATQLSSSSSSSSSSSGGGWLRAYCANSTTTATATATVSECVSDGVEFEPLTGGHVPRYAGLATLLRLPPLQLQRLHAHNAVDVGLIGVPWVSE